MQTVTLTGYLWTKSPSYNVRCTSATAWCSPAASPCSESEQGISKQINYFVDKVHDIAYYVCD
jgi:hypothetical protein